MQHATPEKRFIGGDIAHRMPKQTYNGLHFLYGLGCADHDNCFTCLKKKCTWQVGKAQPDPYYSGGNTNV